MARNYKVNSFDEIKSEERRKSIVASALTMAATLGLAASPLGEVIGPAMMFALGIAPMLAFADTARKLAVHYWLEKEREKEIAKRGGRAVLGMPPKRDAFAKALAEARAKGKTMIDKYLIGFEVDTGEPIWIGEDELCTHAAVFAKTGVGKTLWLESIIFQQMARGRASGLTFIDAKRDSGTLAHIIFMAMVTGRIEDLIVVDPFDAIHSYNFVQTDQRADVKARKVLRAGLPPTSDQSVTKHYDRMAADAIYRLVRAMESFGLSWSIRDIAVALSAFNISYPHIRRLLSRIGAKQALKELGHLAASYRTAKGQLDHARITDNLRGISSELHAIAGSESGQMLCTRHTDLVLTDAILRGKIIYFMLPRLEEAESAARLVKVFREDLEVSIGEITSSRELNLEDPHLVIVDEGSSTFGPTWANLFELARKGRFALLFGAQSAGGLTDSSLGLSESFYERVMANVNLKVTMRVGDNRTASDMAEWIGKVNTTKRTVGQGITYGRMEKAVKGLFDLEARSSGGESETVSLSEDEADLVSPEELKHEMSAEKGLAWFDLGDGRVVKGRSFWFDADIPDSWLGRNFIPRLERFEKDELGLADWVDEQILFTEQKETSFMKKDFGSGPPPSHGTPPHVQAKSAEVRKEEDPANAGPFRLSIMPGGRGRGRVTATEQPQAPVAPASPSQATVAVKKSTNLSDGKNAESESNKAIETLRANKERYVKDKSH
ncbi:MAG: TraM recognition domain-containing protein [bacterium]|nr:TraM recognition domain-containing protein [bacterium]